MSAELNDFDAEDMQTRRRLRAIDERFNEVAMQIEESPFVVMLGAFVFAARCRRMMNASKECRDVSEDEFLELARHARVLADDMADFGDETIAQTALRMAAERVKKGSIQ